MAESSINAIKCQDEGDAWGRATTGMGYTHYMTDAFRRRRTVTNFDGAAILGAGKLTFVVKWL
jgi:hypothetical protein